MRVEPVEQIFGHDRLGRYFHRPDVASGDPGFLVSTVDKGNACRIFVLHDAADGAAALRTDGIGQVSRSHRGAGVNERCEQSGPVAAVGAGQVVTERASFAEQSVAARAVLDEEKLAAPRVALAGIEVVAVAPHHGQFLFRAARPDVAPVPADEGVDPFVAKERKLAQLRDRDIGGGNDVLVNGIEKCAGGGTTAQENAADFFLLRRRHLRVGIQQPL